MTDAGNLLRDRIASTEAALAEMMQGIDLSDRSVLRRFGAAMEGNFLQWLQAAETACLSGEAKAIVGSNVRTEVEEDHPGLLHALLERKNCLPDELDFRDVAEEVDAIDRQCESRDAISLLATAAVLESTAHIFLPTVDKICATSPSVSPFVARHLDVDVVHAEEMRQALVSEWALHSDQVASLDLGASNAMRLFKAVFAPDIEATEATRSCR